MNRKDGKIVEIRSNRPSSLNHRTIIKTRPTMTLFSQSVFHLYRINVAERCNKQHSRSRSAASACICGVACHVLYRVG